MSEQKFAYGKDEIMGCKCPAMAAGFEPNSGDNSLYPATIYDEIVQKLGLTSTNNIIGENDAKKAWIEMIKELEQSEFGDVEVAREIGKELGWL